MAQSYKSNFIDGAQAIYRNIYCEKTFSSWDFAITGESARKSKYEASGSQLKVDITNHVPSMLLRVKWRFTATTTIMSYN